MKRLRYWSVRNARGLHWAYQGLEACLVVLHPIFKRLGYRRLDQGFAAVEKLLKGFLFDSQSCGQCTLSETGMGLPHELSQKFTQRPLRGCAS